MKRVDHVINILKKNTKSDQDEILSLAVGVLENTTPWISWIPSST